MSYVENFPGGFQTSTDKPLDYRSVVANIDALEPKVLQTLYVGLIIFDQATGKHYKIDSTDGTQANLVYSEASGGSARYDIVRARDPLVSDDANVTGVVKNATWFNETDGKLWICRDNAVGAAVWAEYLADDGIVYGQLEHIVFPMPEFTYDGDPTWDEKEVAGATVTVPKTAKYRLSGIVHAAIKDLDSNASVNITQADFFYFSITVNGVDQGIKVAAGTSTNNREANLSDILAVANFNHLIELNAGDVLQLHVRIYNIGSWNATASITVNGDSATGLTHTSSFLDLKEEPTSVSVPVNKVSYGIQANRDPLPTDDVDSTDYDIAVNQVWYNNATGKTWICTNASSGAAVWKKHITEDELPGLSPVVEVDITPSQVVYNDDTRPVVLSDLDGIKTVPTSGRYHLNGTINCRLDNLLKSTDVFDTTHSTILRVFNKTKNKLIFEVNGSVTHGDLSADNGDAVISYNLNAYADIDANDQISYDLKFSQSFPWASNSVLAFAATKSTPWGYGASSVKLTPVTGSFYAPLESFELGIKETRDPVTTDDSNSSVHTIQVNQHWLNTNTGKSFICTDDTPGAAVWVKQVTEDELPGLSATKTFSIPNTQVIHDADPVQPTSWGLVTTGSTTIDSTGKYHVNGSMAVAVRDLNILSGTSTNTPIILQGAVRVNGTNVMDKFFAVSTNDDDSANYDAAGSFDPNFYLDLNAGDVVDVTIRMRDSSHWNANSKLELFPTTFSSVNQTNATIVFTQTVAATYVPTSEFDLGIVANRNPIETDDSDSTEYTIMVNQFWHNEATGHTFVCRDATPGAAVWRKHVTEDELNGYEPAFSGSVFIPQTIAPSATLTSTGYTIPEDSNCTIKYGAFFKAVPSATANLEIKVDGNLVQSIPQSEASINDSFSLDLTKDQVLTAEYTLSEYSNWNDYGRATGLASMNDPRGLAAFNGRVYLADNTGTSAETDVIAVQEQDGTWTNISGESNQPDLTQIGDVAATSNGSYYASRTPAEVWYRTHAGTWINIGEATGHPTWVQPFGITADKDGNIYVVDRDLTDIWKYDGDSWSAIALDATATDPRNIAVTDNYIYVVDQATDTFMRMDRSDNTWTTVAGTGIPTWQDIRRCHAIGTDIYVSDVSAVKIYRYVEPEDRWEDFSALTGQPSSGVIGRSLSDIDGVLIAADYVSDTIWSIQEQVIAGPVAVSIETTPKAYYRPITDISFGISDSRDPTVLDDLSSETYNIQVNQIWLNNTNGTIWVCRDDAIGAAQWVRMVTQEELSGGQLLKSGDTIRSPGVYSASIGAEIAVDPAVDFFVISNWTDIDGTNGTTGGKFNIQWGGLADSVVTFERNNQLLFQRSNGNANFQDMVTRDEFSYSDAGELSDPADPNSALTREHTIGPLRIAQAVFGTTSDIPLDPDDNTRYLLSSNGAFTSWESNLLVYVGPEVTAFQIFMNAVGIGVHEINVGLADGTRKTINVRSTDGGGAFMAYKTTAGNWAFIPSDQTVGILNVNTSSDSETDWWFYGDINIAAREGGSSSTSDDNLSDGTATAVAMPGLGAVQTYRLTTVSGVPTIELAVNNTSSSTCYVCANINGTDSEVSVSGSTEETITLSGSADDICIEFKVMLTWYNGNERPEVYSIFVSRGRAADNSGIEDGNTFIDNVFTAVGKRII